MDQPVLIASEKKQEPEPEQKQGTYGLIDFFQDKEGKWARKRLKTFAPSSLLREAFMGMALPSHKNLIHFRDLEFSPPEGKAVQPQVAFVMPQAQASLIEKTPQMHELTSTQFISLVDQLFCAINVLHQAGFLHLDIKPENILVMTWPKTPAPTDLPHIQLIDYGLSLAQSIGQNLYPNQFISAWYRPPDFLCRSGLGFLCPENLNPKADVFSAGMTTLEMFCYWLFPDSEPLPFYARIKSQQEEKYKRKFNDPEIEKEVAKQWTSFFVPGEFARHSWPNYCGELFRGDSALISNPIERLISLFYDDVEYYMNQFTKKPPTIQKWTRQFLDVMLPTLSFDPNDRPSAFDLVKSLNQKPFVQVPHESKCKVLDYNIFKPWITKNPFAWVKEERQRLSLQSLYHEFALDERGRHRLDHLEDILKQMDLPPSDLFPMMLVLLAFLLPRNEFVERRIAKEQLKKDFFQQLLRAFQHLSKQESHAPRAPILQEPRKKARIAPPDDK